MRTMYDAVTARNILNHNRSPQLVAGYIDKIVLAPWSQADWNLFPNARKVTIVKKASTRDGVVLDVEPGDATPQQAPGWAAQRRRDGYAYPTIYCNRSTWPQVRAAFDAQNVPQPLYWIATASGQPVIPSGAIAAQYMLDYQGVDVSAVADYWPGVDPAPTPEVDLPLDDNDLKNIGNIVSANNAAIRDVMRYFVLATKHDDNDPNASTPDVWTFGGRNIVDILMELLNRAAASQATIDGLAAAVQALSKDPAITADSMREMVTKAVQDSITVSGELRIGPATP